MPRRKRHFIFCKKGLHRLDLFGGQKRSKKKVFEKSVYVTRICLKCRQKYNRKLTHKDRILVRNKKWMRSYRQKKSREKLISTLFSIFELISKSA